MDHRDRAAPVTLARNAPVTQAEVHLALAHRAAIDRLGGEAVGDFLERRLRLHAVEKARIDHHAIIGEGFLGDLEGRGIRTFRHHNRRHRQAVFVGEIQVALVARGAAENRARAVIHQHEIGHIDRQRPFRIEGMAHAHARVETLLLRRLQRRSRGAHAAAFVAECGKLGIVGGQCLRQRMIGGNRHEGRAEQRVGPGRVDLQLIHALRRRLFGQSPADQHAFRTADPVALHQAHLFRPLVEIVDGIDQVLRVIGDLEEPLRQLALLDFRAGAPAATVDHLFVGKHGLIHRVPVDLGGLARHQPLLEEIDKQHLLAVIVIHVTGGELAAPVERQTERLQLIAHHRDVLIGPLLGVHLVLHRRVFRRHAERVPAHRVQHIVAPGALVARDHIAHRVIARVADVNAPGRIGEHLEHIVFRPPVIIAGLEQLCLVPGFLPAGFCDTGIVTFGCHGRIFTR